MVTLLGFFFVLADIILLEIFIPDLVGPVWLPVVYILIESTGSGMLI